MLVESAPISGQARSVSILLVDDEPRNVIALKAALASVECTLVSAHSGQEALRCVLAEDFAVILLDIRMPVMDGFETANLIRGRTRSRSTPIIFLTAYDRVGTRVREGYRLGAIDYIYKPFDPYILRSKVTVFVELFRKTVALERAEQQVRALNAQLEERVIDRTAALAAANGELEAETVERLQTERALRVLEQNARAEAEMAAKRASVLAEVSRVLVEDFMDHGPMLERVARIAARATNTACVIQLIPEEGDDAVLVPLAVDHTDLTVRDELARVLVGPYHPATFPWHDLGRDFLDVHPLMDSLSIPMLARAATIGLLSLGRFGSGAPQFTEGDRRFTSDLAGRVALAVENARLYESSRRAIELRDNFLMIAAHELRTPLTSIQGYSQLLSHQLQQTLGEEAAAVARSARMIEHRTQDLARLVEQILDVSQLVASRMQLNENETDLVAVIKQLVRGFEGRDRSHEFRLHLQRDSMQASVDSARLEQVIANLIENAVRYSPDGGPIDVTLEQEQDGSMLLSVRDRGLGIPEEHRAHIFDRFHQAHANSHRSGMGLGLHISREIVLLHGGQITVDFPEDGGSQFTVRLPRRLEAAADREQA